jgi:hypothetical protein
MCFTLRRGLSVGGSFNYPEFEGIKNESLTFNNRIMRNLIALAHVLEMTTTSNMTVVIEPKPDETVPYKAHVELPELYIMNHNGIYTGKQKRNARRKAERDAKKGKFNF